MPQQNPYDAFSTPVRQQPTAAPQGGPIYTGRDPADIRADQAQNLSERRFQYDVQRDVQRDEIDAQDRAIAAQERAREEQAQAQEMAQADEARRDAVNQLDRMLSRIDTIENDVGDSWFTSGYMETGASGAMLRGIPGSAAYSLQRDLNTLDANQVLQAMTRLKELSPTGSTGFGALSAPELELLRSSVANLDPNSDHGTFMRNLQETRRVYTEMRDRLQNERPSPPRGDGTSGFGRARGGQGPAPQQAPQRAPAGRSGFGRGGSTPPDITDIMRRYGVE